MERKKITAKRKTRPTRVISEHEALAGALPAASLSLQNSARSADSNLENTASSLREILANCGHPLEVIVRKVLIPKLYAKETKFFVIDGKIETRVTDDHNIQLKTAVELLKMCGGYAAEKLELNIDQINPIDMRNVSDDDVKAILKAAARIEKCNSAGEGRTLQAESNDLASGR